RRHTIFSLDWSSDVCSSDLDGDDIITDSGDSGDFLKGEGGNDVIANSNGLDILMGGTGKDVFFVGVDDTEVFGGQGDDFILGGEIGRASCRNACCIWVTTAL